MIDSHVITDIKELRAIHEAIYRYTTTIPDMACSQEILVPSWDWVLHTFEQSDRYVIFGCWKDDKPVYYEIVDKHDNRAWVLSFAQEFEYEPVKVTSVLIADTLGEVWGVIGNPALRDAYRKGFAHCSSTDWPNGEYKQEIDEEKQIVRFWKESNG